MSAGNGRAIRRRIAVIGALLTALSAPLVTATAARAVAPDIAVTIEPQIGDGYVGEVLLVPIRLVNLSPDTASAPMTVVVQVAGSTVNGLSTGAAICQPAPAGCVFTNGLAPGGEAFIGMQVTLVRTGTVSGLTPIVALMADGVGRERLMRAAAEPLETSDSWDYALRAF